MLSVVFSKSDVLWSEMDRSLNCRSPFDFRPGLLQTRRQDILWSEMRRITGTEKGGLALAAVFVIGGLCMILHPMEMVVIHPTEAPLVGSGNGSPQYVSKEGARYYGGGAVLLGTGFASFVLYRPRE